ncbi:MAG TPA: tripartite tricarboxylate transporter TctB family protein [Casimicrobiaceae bacterium]|jgi:hypothetical protein|nr:tripartite tricarboxylate transporter TctB family protein [Casimicrobiaceae bacterium]
MRRDVRTLDKDFWSGAGLVVAGIVYAGFGARYSIGSLSRMGPGFFPVALGAILALSGVAIAIAGWLAAPPAVPVERRKPEWRAWFLISASIVAFVAIAEHVGLVPAAFAIVFISAFADRDNRWRQAMGLALAITAIAVVVFWWALQIQLPLFGKQ